MLALRSRAHPRLAPALLLSGLIACSRGAPAPAEPSAGAPSNDADAETVDQLIAALDDPERAVAAFAALRKLAYEADASDDAATRAQLAARLLPALEARWAAAPLDERLTNLTIAASLADEAGAGLWRLALAGDDPEQARVAVDGIVRARAWSLGDALLERSERELGALAPDGTDEARTRLLVALFDALGRSGHAPAVEVLIQLLEHPQVDSEVPRAVVKAAVSALGLLGDPRAVDTLITVQFRVPDAPSTQSIGERCVRALGAIGEPALPGVLLAFAGNNRRLGELIDQHGLPPRIAEQAMSRILAVIGSPRAVEPLRAAFPTTGCSGAPADEDAYESISLRAFHANSLGWIGAPEAVPTLCSCAGTTNPTDAWELVSALGRIGGAEAFACLAKVVDGGSYDPDLVGPGQALSLRWESFRFAALAAGPAEAPELAALLERAQPEVRAQIDAAGYAAALDVLATCGDDPACNLEVLSDATREPFARERAAFSLARPFAAQTPSDLEHAAAIARAFEVPDPDARVHMAWLSAKLAAGRPCPACAAALESVMSAERLRVDANMQAAWIMARQSIDKLRAARDAP